MKNYIQEGDVIDFVATAAITSGDGVQMGGLFGVAQCSGAIGDTVALVMEGVFLLQKDTSTITVGLGVYWDNTAKKVTTTASSNIKIGFAIEAAATGVGTVKVRLMSIF